MTSVLSQHRKISWTELFFDLVFVAAAHQVALMLKGSTMLGSIPILLVFTLLLWIWVGHTQFSSRFEGRGILYNLLTLLTMGSVLALTVLMPMQTATWLMLFSFIYAGTRVLLILMYVLASLRRVSSFVWLTPYLIGLSASAVLFALAPLAKWPYLLWALALGIELATVIIGQGMLRKVSLHAVHLPERLGLLTMIMLGEIVISLVGSAYGQELTHELAYLLGGALLTMCVIFFFYFRFIEKQILAHQQSTDQRYLYAHLPMFLGLVMLAAGLKGVVSGEQTAWLIAAGALLFALSYRTVKFVRLHRVPRRQIFLLMLLIIGLATYLIVPGSLLLQTAILTGALVVYLVLAEAVFPIIKEEAKHTAMQW